MGAAFDVVGIGALEEGVDAFLEEGEPAVELFLAKVSFGEEFGVGGDGVALVAAVAEENGLPEVVHFGEVGVPVDGGEVVEDEAEEIVGADALVEMIDEADDLGSAFDVLGDGHGGSKAGWGGI